MSETPANARDGEDKADRIEAEPLPPRGPGEPLVAEIEPLRGARHASRWGIALLAVFGLASLGLAGALLFGSLGDGGGWSLGNSEVEKRFEQYLEARRFARAHEGLELVSKSEGDSVRVQRMTLALARAYLEEENPRKAYELVSELPLVDKADEVMVEILRVKFDALRPYFFTPDGDLRAPFNLPCYDTDANFTFDLETPKRKAWSEDRKELARRFLEDLEDAKALMADRPRVREAFAGLIALEALIHRAWGLVKEEDFLKELGDPAILPRSVRYQYANLLFRERRFEDAFSLFRPLLEKERETEEAKRAFAHLIRFFELRRALADRVPLWDYAIGNLVEACLKDPEFAALRESVLASLPRILALASLKEEGELEIVAGDKDVFEGGPPIEDPVLRDPDSPSVLEAFERNVGRENPGRLFFQLDHREFRLTNPLKRPFYSKTGGTLRLITLYRGRVRLHLHRFPDHESYASFDEFHPVKGLRKAPRVRSWWIETGNVSENGNEALSVEVPVRGVEQGYYAVLAEARYAPVFSGTRMIVSDVMLAARAGRTSLLAFTTDRMDGSPAPGVRLRATLRGRYDLGAIAKELLEGNDDPALGRGVADGFAFASEHAKPGPAKLEELRRAGPLYRRGWEAGVNLRLRFPAKQEGVEAVTDENGLALFEVPEPMQAHAYDALVESADTGLCFWSRVRSSEDFHRKTLKTLFYTDRPVYRPGDVVHFKGIVRLFDGEHYFLPGEDPVSVEFANGETQAFASRLVPDDTGCVHGSFPLSTDAPLGAYTVTAGGKEGRAVFKVMHFEKPDLDLTLDVERSILTAGEVLRARIRVTTLAGEPRPGAEVEIVASRIPMELEHRVAFRLPGEASARDPLESGGKLVLSRAFTTDPAGRVSLDLPTDPDMEALYRIRAFVRDKDVYSTASTLVEARAVPVRLTVQTDRKIYRPGDTLDLSVLTRDLRGRPVAWELRLRDLPRPDPKKRKDGKPVEFTPEEKNFETDAKGSSTFQVPVREGCGGFVVGIRFKGVWHDRDVPVTVQAGAGEDDKAVLKADRAVYKPGEEMTVSVSVPPSAKAVLVTGESDRILFSRVLKTEEGRAVTILPVLPEYGPNFFLSATSVNGDRVNTRLSDSVRVVPMDKFLRLEIETDKTEYRPGETCNVLVRVKDFDGTPRAGASISVGVVDVGVYKIEEDRTPDLWTYFYSHAVAHRVSSAWFDAEFDFPGFQIWKVPVLSWGRYWNSAIGLGGGAGGCFGGRFGGRRNLKACGGGRRTERRVRRDFRDLAFWRADLRSDERGVIRFSFPVPDNITRFRFTARGVTPDTRVGEVRDRIAVRKNFYASLRAPDLLREGDRAELRVLVRNRWNFALPARLRFHAPFPVVAGDPTEAVFKAEPGEERVFRFVLDLSSLPANASVPGFELADTGRLGLRWDELPAVFRVDLEASDDSGEADRIVRAFPFARSGAVVRLGRSGILDARKDRTEVTLPLPRDGEKTRVTVHLSGTVSGAVLEGLDDLIEYPYGCVEQTLSRFFPAALACRVKALAGKDGKPRPHLEEAVRRGIANLGRLRLADGTWGWFGRADGSTTFMTAWAVMGLALAGESGFEAPRPWFEGAWPHLSKVLEDPTGAPPRAAGAFGRMNLRVLCGLALSLGGREARLETPQLARYLYEGEAEEHLADLDTAALAFLYALEGMPERSRALSSRILGIRRPSELSDVKTLAFLLLALERTASPGESRFPLVRRLLELRRGRSWRTTADTALAVFALARHLASSGGEEASDACILLDGKEIARIRGEEGRKVLSLEGDALRGKESLNLVLHRRSGGPAFWSATVVSLSKEALKRAESRGLTVEPTLYVPHHGKRYREVPRGKPAVVRNQVRVRLDLTAEEPLEYVIVVQPLPSGFRPAETGARGTGPNRFSMERVRIRSRHGILDPRRYREDLRSCEDAALAGRTGEAWGNLLALAGRALRGGHWDRVWEPERVDFNGPVVVRTEARREALVLFLEGLPKGTHSVFFDLATYAPCEVTLPPAWAAPMYRPEVFGRGTPASLSTEGAGEADAGEIEKTEPWADGAWVESMLAHLSAKGSPASASSTARALGGGENLRAVLIRELIRLGTPEAIALVARGLPYRCAEPGRALNRPGLFSESKRRAAVLEEILRGDPGASSRGILLERFLDDESIYAVLRRDDSPSGGDAVRLRDLLDVLRRERTLRMTAVCSLPFGNRGPARKPLSFRRAVTALLGGGKLPDASFVGAVLEAPGLGASVKGDTYEKILSILREELELPVRVDPLVPPELLGSTILRDDASTERAERESLSRVLRFLFAGIELTLEVSPGSKGIEVVPVGKRLGLPDEAVHRRLMELAERLGN